MIKFFRKIRQKLIQENKMGKYFKYAFGEIILVVIGILIALQVNNWNEQRMAKNQARTYLKNLDAEINQNILVFESTGKNIMRLADIAHHYHTKLFDPSIKVHDSVITNFIIKINSILTFNPSQTVLKDFLASGYLKDIKNDKLKNSILFLESRYASYDNRIKDINEYYNEHIEPNLMNNGDYSQLYDSIYQYKVVKAEFGHTRNAFVKNKTLSNQLIWYFAFLGEANNGEIKFIIERLKLLSKRINTYLND